MERHWRPDATIACAQGDVCNTDDSEHPKTQQRDRKIGQTIGSPMRISAVQLVLFTKGMEARIRKKQEERSRLCEPLGSLGEPLGNSLGRLGEGFVETQRAFFLRNMLDFHNNRLKNTLISKIINNPSKRTQFAIR